MDKKELDANYDIQLMQTCQNFAMQLYKRMKENPDESFRMLNNAASYLEFEPIIRMNDNAK